MLFQPTCVESSKSWTWEVKFVPPSPRVSIGAVLFSLGWVFLVGVVTSDFLCLTRHRVRLEEALVVCVSFFFSLN